MTGRHRGARSPARPRGGPAEVVDFCGRGNGHIASHRTCQPFTRIRDPWWRSGDRIEMHATYNHDAATHGDMGIMVAFVDED